MTAPLPLDYAAWRHCIEVDCRIPLTATFCTERLVALRSDRSEEVRRFAKLYGEPHLERVIAWFEQASRDGEG
jgi:hypothetical protein